MKTLQWVLGLLVAAALLTPLFAAAQTDSSTTVSVQVQSLLSQITSLEQQLHTLLQSVATSSTSMMWDGSRPNASSTPVMWGPGPAVIASSTPPGMGNCPSFGRDLSVGSQGNDVMQLQQMLAGDGFFSASTTGYFGQLTASALDQFQAHFDISTSSAGFFGPLTRTFIGAHCGQGQGQNGGHMMGSSTPPMWQGSSTPPMSPMKPWMGTSTNPGWQGGPMGSSTPMRRPCPQNSPNSALGAAAALFIPHAILPPMMNPCGGGPQASTTQQ
jgi:peptidoglycan hydrolase-like protein with peptidoglycan-binding domain